MRTMQARTRPDLPGATFVRVTLGSLFVTQFFANIRAGNFTERGYRRLVTSYIDRADAPGWWKSFEQLAIDHSTVFALAQAVGEITLGVALVMGVARLAAGLGAAALLALLWLSELGIYWTWELVPAIAIAVAVAVDAWRGRRGPTPHRLVGPIAFGPRVRLLAPFVGAGLVAFAVLANGDPAVDAWRAAPVVGGALAVSALLDARFRTAA